MSAAKLGQPGNDRPVYCVAHFLAPRNVFVGLVSKFSTGKAITIAMRLYGKQLSVAASMLRGALPNARPQSKNEQERSLGLCAFILLATGASNIATLGPQLVAELRTTFAEVGRYAGFLARAEQALSYLSGRPVDELGCREAFIDTARFEKTSALSRSEAATLRSVCNGSHVRGRSRELLARLVAPLDAALTDIHLERSQQAVLFRSILFHVKKTKRSYWAWSPAEWLESARSSELKSLKDSNRSASTLECDPDSSNHQEALRLSGTFIIAYRLGGLELAKPLFDELFHHGLFALASRLFGRACVEVALEKIQVALINLGHPQLARNGVVKRAVAALCLRAGSTDVAGFKQVHLQGLFEPQVPKTVRLAAVPISLALQTGGYNVTKIVRKVRNKRLSKYEPRAGVSSEWLAIADKWLANSSLESRKGSFNAVISIGRWMAVRFPEVRHPKEWDVRMCAEYVAAVNSWRVGDYLTSIPVNLRPETIGKPVVARTKNTMQTKARSFFSDLQEWEWIPRRFNPAKALRTPKSVKALLGPDPRDIELALWVKLTWAAHHLEVSDVPNRVKYPFEMIKALAICWVYIALRNSDYRRLRVGCARQDIVDLTDPAFDPESEVAPDNRTGR